MTVSALVRGRIADDRVALAAPVVGTALAISAVVTRAGLGNALMRSVLRIGTFGPSMTDG